MIAASLVLASLVSGAPPPEDAVAFRLASPDAPLIVVPVRINGQGPFQFVLDTGASMSMVTPALARKLGLGGGVAGKGVGAGGSVKVKVLSVHSLSVGQAHAEELQVAAGDLSDIGAQLGTQVDGIVGYNFLKSFQMTVDYPRAQLILRKPEASAATGAAPGTTASAAPSP